MHAYAAANGYAWANYIFGKRLRCNRVGSLHLHMQLPMTTSRLIIFLGDVADAIGGPITYVHVTADSYIWVDYFSGKCLRCNRVGPLHMHMQLLMAMSGLIFVLGCDPDATWWAHCICICGCRWLCLGRLFFRRCY